MIKLIRRLFCKHIWVLGSQNIHGSIINIHCKKCGKGEYIPGVKK